MRLSNRAYDILKAIFEILVLLATFWVEISDAWNLPYTEPIQRTILAISAVILGILKISTVAYKNALLNQGEDIGEYIPNEDVVDHEMDEGEG